MLDTNRCGEFFKHSTTHSIKVNAFVMFLISNTKSVMNVLLQTFSGPLYTKREVSKESIYSNNECDCLLCHQQTLFLCFNQRSFHLATPSGSIMEISIWTVLLSKGLK